MTRRALICAAALLTLGLVTGAGPAAGASGDSAQPRVVGGMTTSTATFPWQAAVAFTLAKKPSQDGFQRQFCGGSLVTSRIVLTAAHCVYNIDPDCSAASPVLPCTVVTDPPPGDGTARLDPDDVEVFLGRTVLNSGAGTVHPVQAVSFQDDYDPNFNGPNGVPSSDVGYLVLTDTPVTTAQAPIKIASGAETPALWTPGVFVDVTGWGRTSQNGAKSNTLRGGSVPIVSDSSCATSYGSDFNMATMVCAGYQEGGVDTCQGDSGGPLESPLATPAGGYRLVGITSWGLGCALAGFPGVYTRVADPTLLAAIEAKVDALEAAQAPPLTDETVISDGTGTPRGGITFPPPTPPSGGNTVVVPPPPESTDPFKKCKKIKSKKKKKKCNRKVKASL